MQYISQVICSSLLRRGAGGAVIVAFFIVNCQAAQKTWTGTTDTAWTTASNWSPGGVPASTDTVTIVTGSNQCHLTQNTTVNRITLTSGTLQLHGFTLTVNNHSTFNGGTVSGTANPALILRGTRTTFAGTTVNAIVETISNRVELNGSTFNNKCYLEQTGGTTSNGTGSNTFNDTVTLANSGTANFNLAQNTGDTYNALLKVYMTGTHDLVVSKKTSYFNGNIELNMSGSGEIYLGTSDGDSSYLASGKTISAGDSGITGGVVIFNKFVQQGNTSQTLTATSNGSSGNGVFNMISSVFNGALNVTAPVPLFKNNVFYGALNVTKTTNISALSDGGNRFYGDVIIDNNSAQQLRMANNTRDKYYGNVSFIGSSTGVIRPFYNDTTEVHGNLSVTGNKVELDANNGIVRFAGSNNQTVSGNLTVKFKNPIIEKTGGHVTLDTSVSVSGTLKLVSGNIITTSAHLLTMLAGSLVTGASNSSFVSGPVKKVGNTAFTFPTGKGSSYRAVEISAPSNSTDAFTGEYFDTGQALGSAISYPLNTISDCSYWKLDRNSGSSGVVVKLQYDSVSCDRIDVKPVHITQWTGSYWNDLSTGVTDGLFKKTSSSVSSFGYFAFAYNLEYGDACRRTRYIETKTDCQPTAYIFHNKEFWIQAFSDSVFMQLDIIKDDTSIAFSFIKSITLYEQNYCHLLTPSHHLDFEMSAFNQPEQHKIFNVTPYAGYFIKIERYDSTVNCGACSLDSTYLKICIRNISTPIPVTISSTTIGHSKDYFGYNIPNIIQDEKGLEEQGLMDALKGNSRLFPGTLRYPGGTAGNWWNWRTGWFIKESQLPFSWHLPNNYINYSTQNIDNSISIYRNYIDNLGASNRLVINMLSSDAPYQAAMLAECQRLNLPSIVIELGNEFYTDLDEHIQLYPKAENYATECGEWTSVFRQTFGNDVRVGMVGGSLRLNQPPYMRRNAWLQNIMPVIDGLNTDANTENDIDAVILHDYYGLGIGPSKNFPALTNTNGEASKLYNESLFVTPFKKLQELKENEFQIINSSASQPEIWITEFNLTDRTNDNHKVHGTWAHALFASSMLLGYLEEPTVTRLNIHTLTGDGIWGSLFNSIEGLDFFATPCTTCSTNEYEYTAAGNAISAIAQTIKNTTFHSKLIFPGAPELLPGIPGIYGWWFEGPESYEAIILRLDFPGTTPVFSGINISALLSATGVNCSITTLFQSGVDYNDDPKLLGDGVIGNATPSGGVHLITLAASTPSNNFLFLPPYSLTKLVFEKTPPQCTIAVADNELCDGESTGVYIYGREASASFLTLTNSGCTCSASSNSSALADEYVTVVTCYNSSTTTAGTCTLSIGGATAVITVHPALPTVNITAAQTPSPAGTFYMPGTITLTATATGGTVDYYIWTRDHSAEGIITPFGNPTVVNDVNATETFTLHYSNNLSNRQCWGNAEINVPVCKADAGPDRKICANQAGDNALIGTTSVTGLSYLWSTSATTSQITVKPSSTTIYNVTVYDSNGCSATDEVSVNVLTDCCTGGIGDYVSRGESTLRDLRDYFNANSPPSPGSFNCANGVCTLDLDGTGLNIFLNGDVTINNLSPNGNDPRFIFRNCNIFFNPNAKIITSAANKDLTFEACSLARCGTDLWDGVYMSNPSDDLFITSGTTVEGCANCFVTSRETKVTVTDAAFSAFHRALVFNDYDDPAEVTITGNTFTGSNNLPAPYSGQRSACIICIDDVQRITVGNLSGAANTLSTADKGIVAVNSDVNVYNNTFSGFPQVNMTDMFDGTAIDCSNDFTFDLRLWPRNNIVVQGNTFDGSTDEIHYGIKTTNVNTYIGVDQNASEANTMDYVRNGIYAVGGWAKTTEIANNTITNTHTGIRTWSHRDNISIRNNTVTVSDGGNAAIQVDGAWSESGFSEIKGNSITSEGMFGVLTRSAYVTIKENTIAMNHNSAATPVFGIRAEATPTGKIGCNTVQGNGTTTIANKTAISCTQSHELSVQCNTTDETSIALEFLADCDNSMIQGNEMKYHDYGIYIGDGGIPTGGVIGPQTLNDDNESRGNKYQGENDSGVFPGGDATFTFNSDPPVPFWVEPNIPGTPTIYYTPQSNGTNQTGNQITPVPPIGNPPIFDCATTNNCSDLRISHPGSSYGWLDAAEAIATDSIPGSDDMEAALKWSLKRNLYMALLKDSTLSDSSEALQAFFESMAQRNTGKLAEVTLKIAEMNTDTAQPAGSTGRAAQLLSEAASLNEEVDPENIVEENEKLANSIYLASAGQDIPVGSEWLTALEQGAFQCPYTGGEAVFRLRSLYVMMHGNTVFDDAQLCAQNNQRIKQLKNKIFNTSYIKLLPNPNNGTFAFEYDLKNYATAAVELFDGTGRIVLIKYFSTAKNYESLEATVLPAGMYGYRIKLNGIPFRSGKIAIVK